VPCLGDIPILGYFFSSIGKASEKTNLYIFLTPRVLESAEEIKELYRKKEREMNELKEGIIKMYNGEEDGKPQTKQQKRKAKISEWIVP
jgi:general secretion pathway protein D